MLDAVEASLLNADVLETAMARALAAYQAEQTPDAKAPVRRELAQIETELARLTTAIAQGGPLESLLAALQASERRRAELRAALAKEERQQARQRGRDEVLATIRQAIDEWKVTLRARVPEARRALQALLKERLVFTPTADGYTFEAPGTVESIISGLVAKGTRPRTRTIPPAIRRALQHRDRGCRFPGCHVRVGQGHHINHWAQGGPTTFSNLTMLCRRHHRAVHEEGWRATVPTAQRRAVPRRPAASGSADRSRRRRASTE